MLFFRFLLQMMLVKAITLAKVNHTRRILTGLEARRFSIYLSFRIKRDFLVSYTLNSHRHCQRRGKRRESFRVLFNIQLIRFLFSSGTKQYQHHDNKLPKNTKTSYCGSLTISFEMFLIKVF